MVVNWLQCGLYRLEAFNEKWNGMVKWVKVAKKEKDTLEVSKCFKLATSLLKMIWYFSCQKLKSILRVALSVFLQTLMLTTFYLEMMHKDLES